MKRKLYVPIVMILMIVVVSCNSDKKKSPEKVQALQTVKQPVNVDKQNVVSESSIGLLPAEDLDFDIGCTTEYQDKKGVVYAKGSAPNSKGWISYMKINDALEKFYTPDGITESTNGDGSVIVTHLENDHYKVVITSKIGNYSEEADSVSEQGTIVVTDKKSGKVVSVEFEGGTAC